METDSVIVLRNLTRDYGTARALDNINLEVGRGEIFGYLGANGAGKTTTIRILTGLLRPTFGDAFVCGRNIALEPMEVKARIGYVPESGAIFEKLSPNEYLTIIGQLYKLPASPLRDRIDYWLRFFRVSERADQRMEVFSKGTRQKICWIAALLHEPEILILDEPLNGLDVETIAAVKELMKSFAASGRTIFYSSHLIDVVEKVCTRIAILQNGRLIGGGTIDEVRMIAGGASLEEGLLRMWQEQR
ncbi:MAG TPA: ABC transporter ATP-binding protein [Blastocatellia bacterium]|nr:ABC transporter ATP-binding protein [Blastocatellia bacterium]